MSEIELDEGAQSNGPPAGYEKDALTIALMIPVIDVTAATASKDAEVPDGTDADDHRRTLKAIELTLTTEIARLQNLIDQNRPMLTKITDDSHIKNLDKIQQAVSQTGDKVLATVSRLKNQVDFLHKEYQKSAAKKLPSATTYRDQIQDQGNAIGDAKTEGLALLARVDKALSGILSTVQQALLAYQKLQDEAFANWTALSDEVKTSLGELQDAGSARFEPLQASYAELAKNADKDYIAALAELKKLKPLCAQAMEQHKFAAEEERKARQAQLDEIKARIEMPTLWDRLGGNWDVKQLFKGPMEQAERMLKTADNRDAMRAAVQMAREAEAIFLDFKGSEKEIEQMSWDRDGIKRVLDTYKADRPKDYKVVQGKFDTLEKSWQKMKPSAAAKAFADLRIEVGVDVSHVWANFRGRCEVERKWREDYKRVATEIKSDLDALDKKIKEALGDEGKEGYQGQARAEYRGLVAVGESEVEQEALMAPLTKRLTELRAKVKSYLAVPNKSLKANPESLDGAAAKLVSDQTKGMAERKAFLEEYENLRVHHKAAIAAHKDLSSKKFTKEDQREYDDIKKMLDKAAEIAKAKKEESNLQEVATALAISKRCKQRADQLAEGGPKVDRGKLAALNELWAAGLDSFDKDLVALVAAVQTLTDQEPRPDDKEQADSQAKSYYGAHERVQSAVDIVKKYFDNTDRFNFAKEAKILATEGDKTKTDRKRAREEVLTNVRNAMDFLLGNPATRVLMANPFGQTSVGAKFYKSMRSIELEVLRSE